MINLLPFIFLLLFDSGKSIDINNCNRLWGMSNTVGNIDIYRDWGWAPEFVKAYWLMLQQKNATDLIIGTGKVYSLRDFVKEVFKIKKIDIKKLKTNVSHLKRKLDIKGYKADISKTSKVLKWRPRVSFKKIVEKMINEDLF